MVSEVSNPNTQLPQMYSPIGNGGGTGTEMEQTTTDLSEIITVDMCVTMWATDMYDITGIALNRIRSDLEGVCGSHGYVSSINHIEKTEQNPLINCTSGLGDFNMSMSVNMTRYLPKPGQTFVCKISGSEPNLGVELAHYNPFLVFILTEHIGEDGVLSDKVESVSNGDDVLVRIMKAELNRGDTSPTIIASLVHKL